MTTLADVSPGLSAVVTGFDEDSPVAARLLQLGMLEGTSVTVVRRAPAGDPIEITFAGGRLSLRKSEARLVRVTAAR